MNRLAVKGALANIERRTQAGGASFNEFGVEPRIVDFNASRRVLPPIGGCHDNIRTVLRIELQSAYTTFHGDDDRAISLVEENAMRALCRCLYQDVLDDLMPIMQAVGDGKRRDALTLLNQLYTRLDGRE